MVDPQTPLVCGDPIQLEQVAINLLRNAIEAHQVRPGEALLSVRPGTPGEALLAVHDRGPGLPELPPETLFDAFQTTKARGLGMGLAVSRTIAEAHGGTLEAADRPGGGASFTCRLPAADASEECPRE